MRGLKGSVTKRRDTRANVATHAYAWLEGSSQRRFRVRQQVATHAYAWCELPEGRTNSFYNDQLIEKTPGCRKHSGVFVGNSIQKEKPILSDGLWQRMRDSIYIFIPEG